MTGSPDVVAFAWVCERSHPCYEYKTCEFPHVIPDVEIHVWAARRSAARHQHSSAARLLFGKPMNITTRYAEIPEVTIDPTKVPEQFQHLIPLAKEWSISDDLELDAYVEAASEAKKRELATAFVPHFDALWKWHLACENLIPQPDELVLFDIAANAAATVHSMLS
jgi:hypothetical protein